MNNLKLIVCYMIIATICISCNGGTGKKYAPDGREQAFASEDARKQAIEKKRAELDSLQLDIETLVFENNIKLTILPPAPVGDITLGTSKAMATKMMQITAQNGIGGFGNSPAFCLATILTPTGRASTGTIPQRMITKYTITFVVGNMITGDVYATHNLDVEGAGATFEEATNNAVASIKNSNDLQQMLKTASEKIISWYNGNPQGFKAIVERFVATKDYETAYALLATVPQQATSCFAYAAKRQEQVLEDLKVQKAEELLTDLKNAIASAKDKYNPMVAGYLKMIPANSKQHAEAVRLYDDYTKHVQDVRLDSIKHEQKVELERLAVQQIKMKYEQEAAMKQAEKVVASSDEDKESSGGLLDSFTEHPFLWGLGAGALLAGAGGIALYGSLPLMGKLALAFLI